MPRSLKKGPFVDLHLEKKVDDQNAKNTKTVIKDLVTSLNDYAINDWSHHCSP